MTWRRWDKTGARLGVNTERGQHARHLAADVADALKVTGIHEMRAGEWLRVPAFLPPLRKQDHDEEA